MQDTQHWDGEDPLRVYAMPQQHVINMAIINQSEFWSRQNLLTNKLTSWLGDYSPTGKVEAISQVQVSDLMDSDGVTPLQKEIWSFLGMVLYYQHFILLSSSLNKRLVAKPSAGGCMRKKCSSQVKLSAEDWTSECQDTFDTVTQSIAKCDTNQSWAFYSCCGCLFDGNEAVLSQLQHAEKVARPVAFASKTLSKSKSNSSQTVISCLKADHTQQVFPFAKRKHFTAWYDNNPLTYILMKPRLDACKQRWEAKLAGNDFDLKYVPWPKSTAADAFSCEPFIHSSISHRLVKEPCLSLLDEINGVLTGTVQDAFRLTKCYWCWCHLEHPWHWWCLPSLKC